MLFILTLTTTWSVLNFLSMIKIGLPACFWVSIRVVPFSVNSAWTLRPSIVFSMNPQPIWNKLLHYQDLTLSESNVSTTHQVTEERALLQTQWILELRNIDLVVQVLTENYLTLRLLSSMHPSLGQQIKLVFFIQFGMSFSYKSLTGRKV